MESTGAAVGLTGLSVGAVVGVAGADVGADVGAVVGTAEEFEAMICVDASTTISLTSHSV